MSADTARWGISFLAIFLLGVAAWQNRRAGYRKGVSEMPADVVRMFRTDPRSADQLVRLSLAIHGRVPVENISEAAGVAAKG